MLIPKLGRIGIIGADGLMEVTSVDGAEDNECTETQNLKIMCNHASTGVEELETWPVQVKS